MTQNDLTNAIYALLASDLSDAANRMVLADALEEAGRTLTAMDYVAVNQNVVLRYASQGAAGGQDIALLDETELPFSLSDIEGEINDDGDFEATNLNVEGGAWGWQFKDFGGSQIFGLWLRIDEEVWHDQYAEVNGYTLTMSDDSGASHTVEFAAGGPDEGAIEEEIDSWVNDGDWGDEGASIDVRWSLKVADKEIEEGYHTVEVEPNHELLIHRATRGHGSNSCGNDPEDHDWEDEGVWSGGGTVMIRKSHCSVCGLRRTERTCGSQRNPGEHDTVSYEMPKQDDDSGDE